MQGISILVNVVREETTYLPRLLSSVKNFASQVVIIDMTEGDEKLQEIAQKYEAEVYEHKLSPVVEEARNYGISKTNADWILILDPDEEIPDSLGEKLLEIVKANPADFIRVPRKNIVFGKWIQHARWWPDYNVRFFKRGHVRWDKEIHKVPITTGKGLDFDAKEEYAILHHHYDSISQYVLRLERYTTVQASIVASNPNYRFVWMDLIKKPASEFLSRYFAGNGYKEGLHGLSICLLQAFSELVIYLKVWEKEKFHEQGITPKEISQEFGKVWWETSWWISDMLIKEKGFLLSLPLRIRRKLKRKKE